MVIWSLKIAKTYKDTEQIWYKTPSVYFGLCVWQNTLFQRQGVILVSRIAILGLVPKGIALLTECAKDETCVNKTNLLRYKVSQF